MYWWLHWIKEGGVHKVPSVWMYTSTRMLLAALTSFVVALFLGPRVIKYLYEMKIGQSIRKDECPHLGKLHAKKENTPTMGGFLMLAAVIVSMFFWMDVTHSFTWILLFVTLGLAIVGGIDDYLKIKHKNSKGLRGRYKFLGQVMISLVLGLYLYAGSIGSMFDLQVVQERALKFYFPFFKEPIFVLSSTLSFLGVLWTIFVVTGSSNAVNLTDGLDGLATGSLLFVAATLALVAFISNNSDIARYLNILHIEGSGEVAIFMSAIAGAALGFLWYNCYPAQVFMGDIGSLAFGGALGAGAILLRREFFFALVGGIFVIEALSVIIQVLSYRLRKKKRVFLCAPIHHHFEYKGWHESKVVVRFWIIGFLLALVGMLSLKFQ